MLVFRRALGVAFDLFAPRFCAGCDAPLGVEDLFCDGCDASIESNAVSARLDSGIVVVAAGTYGGALARAIQAMKYENRPDLAAPLGRRLANVAALPDLRPGLFVPVPLHPRRLAERGYNQSALVACHVARELRRPVNVRALRRKRETSEQAKLGRDERLENVRGAVIERQRLDGERVILVDDVVTTGATASACAEALERAGAVVLAVAAVARA